MKRHRLGGQISLPFSAGSSGDWTIFPMTNDGNYYYILSYSNNAIMKTADFLTFTTAKTYPSTNTHYALIKQIDTTTYFAQTDETTYTVYFSKTTDGFATETMGSATFTDLRRCIDVFQMDVGGVLTDFFAIEGYFYDSSFTLVASDTSIIKQSVGYVRDGNYYFLGYDGTNVNLYKFDGSTISKVSTENFPGTISELYFVCLMNLGTEDPEDIMMTTGVTALRYLGVWHLLEPSHAVPPIWNSDYSDPTTFFAINTATLEATLRYRFKTTLVILDSAQYTSLKGMGGYGGFICQESFVQSVIYETVSDFVKVEVGYDFYHDPFCNVTSTEEYSDDAFLYLLEDSYNPIFGGWYRAYHYDSALYIYNLESPIKNDLMRRVDITFTGKTVSEILQKILSIYCLALKPGSIDTTTDTYDIEFSGKTVLDVFRWCDNVEGKITVFTPDMSVNWTAFASSGMTLTVGVDSLTDPTLKKEALHISRVELTGGFDPITGERITAVAQNTYDYGTYRDSFPEVTDSTVLQNLADKILANLNLSINTVMFKLYGSGFVAPGQTYVLYWDDLGISGDTYYIYGVIYDPITGSSELKTKSALYIPPLNQELENIEVNIKLNNLEQQVSQVSSDLSTYLFSFGFGPAENIIFLKKGYMFQDLQDAVDHLTDHGGGTLFVPAGICYFSGTLNITVPINIIGTGSSFWYPDPSVTASLSIMVTINSDDVRISGIVIDLSSLATGTADYGIISYYDRTIIEKCRLIGGSTDNEYLIDIRGSGCIIRDNIIEDSSGTTYFGIRATTSSDHTIIQGNRVNGCTYGIANYGPHTIITGNVADGCSTDGIFVYVSKTTTGAYVSIVGNTCIGGGITVYYSQYVTISGNMCEDLAITSCDNVVYVGNSASTITTTGSTALTSTGNGW